jgi:hypothetical protein
MMSKVNRREFLALALRTGTLAALPVIPLAASATAAAASAAQPATTAAAALPPIKLQPSDKIMALEAELEALQGRFSWYHHNELRHEYYLFDQRQSMYHVNAILGVHVLDEYILNTITDWHLRDSAQWHPCARAIELLLYHAQTYPDFVHLRAAALLQAAHLLYHTNGVQAQQLYNAVLTVEGAQPRYAELAHAGLRRAY